MTARTGKQKGTTADYKEGDPILVRVANPNGYTWAEATFIRQDENLPQYAWVKANYSGFKSPKLLTDIRRGP